jgi:hypothetical protein
MLSHGLTTGGLFLAIGVLYERRHTRRMAEFGGCGRRCRSSAPVPHLRARLGRACPGLSGFIGEFLTIFGTFISGGSHFPEGWPHFIPFPKILAAAAATGVILGAVYLLYMFQKVMFGPARQRAEPRPAGRQLARDRRLRAGHRAHLRARPVPAARSCARPRTRSIASSATTRRGSPSRTRRRTCAASRRPVREAAPPRGDAGGGAAAGRRRSAGGCDSVDAAARRAPTAPARRRATEPAPRRAAPGGGQP